MNPWDLKRQIETAFTLADRYGFELRDYAGYGYEQGLIYLYAAPTNQVFSKDMVLNYFRSWADVMLFFQGYEKADMAWTIGGKKK